MGVDRTGLNSEINWALMKHDKNHDGKLTAGELKAAIKNADKNNNGLDIKEVKALVGSIEYPTTTVTPEIRVEDVHKFAKLNQLVHSSKPNTVVFQMTKDSEKQFKLEQCRKIVKMTNEQIPFVADRAGNVQELAKSVASVPMVATERTINGMPRGHLSRQGIHKTAQNAVKLKSGNCYEMACVAFTNAERAGAKKVELFSVDNHLFVVVNRSPNSKENDPKTWGPEAMIIDPWAKQAYPASEYFLHKEMKNQAPFFEGPYGDGVIG